MRLLLLTISSVWLLLACGSDEIPDPTETKPNYFPDAIGSKWVYRNADGSEWTREVIDRNGSQVGDYLTFNYYPSTAETEIDFLSPTFFSINENQILFDVEKQIDRYIHTDLLTLAKDEFQGLEVDVTLEPISDPNLFFFQIPLTITSQWSALNVSVNGNITLQNLSLLKFPFNVHFLIEGKVVSEESIETPAGRFETTFKVNYNIKIMHTVLSNEVLTRSDQIIWYVPHVGMVKIENENGVTELTEYIVK